MNLTEDYYKFQQAHKWQVSKFSIHTRSYLRSFCTLVSSLPARASLRSSTHHLFWLFAHELCYGTIQELCLCWPLSLELSSTVPVHGINIPLISPAAKTL